jgi:hypothetical protein
MKMLIAIQKIVWWRENVGDDALRNDDVGSKLCSDIG